MEIHHAPSGSRVREAAVTGGSGFLGSHLVHALRREGWTVTALARSAPARRALEAAGCHVVDGDLHDEVALSTLVTGAGLVFHLGGLVAARSEAEFRRVNADGTAALTRAAAATGVRRLGPRRDIPDRHIQPGRATPAALGQSSCRRGRQSVGKTARRKQ